MSKKRRNPIKRVLLVKEKYERDLLARPGVTGVGVGMRQRQGKFIDEVVIVVMVTKKVARADLNMRDLLPAELDGVPVDVLEVGGITAE